MALLRSPVQWGVLGKVHTVWINLSTQQLSHHSGVTLLGPQMKRSAPKLTPVMTLFQHRHGTVQHALPDSGADTLFKCACQSERAPRLCAQAGLGSTGTTAAPWLDGLERLRASKVAFYKDTKP